MYSPTFCSRLPSSGLRIQALNGPRASIFVTASGVASPPPRGPASSACTSFCCSGVSSAGVRTRKRSSASAVPARTKAARARMRFMAFPFRSLGESQLEIPQLVEAQPGSRLHHDGGIRRLDDRRTGNLVPGNERLAVVDGSGFLLPEIRPVDVPLLAHRLARDRRRDLLCLHQLRLRRERAGAQAADDDLELRAGQRRAAAVELLVARDEDLAKLGLVLGREAREREEDLDLVDLSLVADVERELEALAVLGGGFSPPPRARLFFPRF